MNRNQKLLICALSIWTFFIQGCTPSLTSTALRSSKLLQVQSDLGIDSNFGSGGFFQLEIPVETGFNLATAQIEAAKRDPLDGSIYVAGALIQIDTTGVLAQQVSPFVMKLTASGSLDVTFGLRVFSDSSRYGRIASTGIFSAIELPASDSNKVYLMGQASSETTSGPIDYDALVFRLYRSDGNADQTFGLSSGGSRLGFVRIHGGFTASNPPERSEEFFSSMGLTPQGISILSSTSMGIQDPYHDGTRNSLLVNLTTDGSLQNPNQPNILITNQNLPFLAIDRNHSTRVIYGRGTNRFYHVHSEREGTSPFFHLTMRVLDTSGALVTPAPIPLSTSTAPGGLSFQFLPSPMGVPALLYLQPSEAPASMKHQFAQVDPTGIFPGAVIGQPDPSTGPLTMTTAVQNLYTDTILLADDYNYLTPPQYNFFDHISRVSKGWFALPKLNTWTYWDTSIGAPTGLGVAFFGIARSSSSGAHVITGVGLTELR